MQIGKLPNDILKKIVLSNIKTTRKEVLVGADIGKDSAIIDFGPEVCVLSTDPITAATKDIGKIAIHISCNDVAAGGAEPIGALMTLLVPPSATEDIIETIMKDAEEAAKEINIQIIGGHTEITDAVNRIVISTTVIGKQNKEKLPDVSKIKIGDKVVITKYAGIEGTSILAKELEQKLINKLGKEKLDMAKSMDSMLSVVQEGIVCGKIGVRYMHDITEGGVFGAIWEAAIATNKGIKVSKDLIPVKDITKEIADILDIDLYRLISSGSMLIIVEREKAPIIGEELQKLNIESAVIGEIIEKGIILEENGETIDIEPPSSDELYKALEINR